MTAIYKCDAVRRHTKDRGKNVTTRWMAAAQDLFAENEQLRAFNATGAERLAHLKAESKRRHDQFCAETLRTSELMKENAKLRELLEQMLNVAENADETGYVTDCGFIDLDKLHEKVRATLTPAGVVRAVLKAQKQAKPSNLKLD